MRRADRLFQIVQLIRGRRLTTAAFLAQRLEISLRTVYRDIANLQHQGVPVQGAAGVGYRLGAGFLLPPLMFTQEEAAALVATVRLAQGWLDPALACASEGALGKVLAVLPAEARAAAESLAVYAPRTGLAPEHQQTLQTLRQAVQQRRLLSLTYRDAAGRESRRRLRPLGCFFWGDVWTVAGWCEERNDFRTFRIDRIGTLEVLADRFPDQPGQTLMDLFRRVEPVRTDGLQVPCYRDLP